MVLESASIKKVACGAFSTIILKTNGEVLVTGSNVSGKLGMGFSEGSKKFVPLLKDSSVLNVYAGYDASFVLKKGGELYVFGDGSNGACGTGDLDNRRKPTSLNLPFKVRSVACGCRHTLLLGTCGELFSSGSNVHGKQKVSICLTMILNILYIRNSGQLVGFQLKFCAIQF